LAFVLAMAMFVLVVDTSLMNVTNMTEASTVSQPASSSRLRKRSTKTRK
jgi:hypothetical protein